MDTTHDQHSKYGKSIRNQSSSRSRISRSARFRLIRPTGFEYPSSFLRWIEKLDSLILVNGFPSVCGERAVYGVSQGLQAGSGHRHAFLGRRAGLESP